MFAKYLTSASLVAAIAITPIAAVPAQAQDARDVIGGLLLGGAIGAAIASANQPRTTVIVPQQPAAQPQQPAAQPHQPRPPRQVRPAIPATEAGRQVQTALNYFGFDAGYVDGQVGPSTRRAVERYQAALGHPVNGNSFPEPQAQYLIGAYLWATNGGQGQTNLHGTPLLVAYRNVLNGTTGPTYASQPGAGQPYVPAPNTTTVIVNPGNTSVVPAPGTNAPPAVTTVAAPGTNVVPNLFAGASTSPVLSSRCDAVALQGQANGGQMTLGNLTNAGFALSEQFCAARASAMTQGHDLTQAITGLTYAQITGQCEGFSAAVSAQTGLIGAVTPQQAIGSTQGFAFSTGIPAAELAATARVCLGVGYSTDNMDMAMGSALILAASGEPAYGELLGHHLREGYGKAVDDYRAHEWFEVSLTAIEGGAPAVFNAADAGRLPLIRQAVAITLGGAPQVVPTSAPAQVPTLNFAPQNVVAPAGQAVPRPSPAPTPAPVAVVRPEPIAPRIVPAPVVPEVVLSQEPEVVIAPFHFSN